jgi:hypothetical protein
MMRMRQAMVAALPLVAMAVCLAPGLSARQHPPVVKHKLPNHHIAKRTLQKPSRPKVKRQATKHEVVGARTASQSLGSNKGSVYPKRKVRGRVRRHSVRMRMPAGPSSERITEIQEALNRSGYYPGDPTGKWDSGTVNAMKRFQQAEGISPTGKIDAISLQELGLGSDVAGVGAPRPMLPAETTGADSKDTSKPTGGSRF